MPERTGSEGQLGDRKEKNAGEQVYIILKRA